jgi:catechol 2,3-dioxygenase-like lactoylglutathione lyase family enzyme
MIDHTGVSVSNFEKSKKFYTEALKPIGYKLLLEFPASITGNERRRFWKPPRQISDRRRDPKRTPFMSLEFSTLAGRRISSPPLRPAK